MNFANPSPTFCKMVDDLVLYAINSDKELHEGIKWLDDVARKENKSLYQKVYEVLYKHDIKEKAENWRSSKK